MIRRKFGISTAVVIGLQLLCGACSQEGDDTSQVVDVRSFGCGTAVNAPDVNAQQTIDIDGTLRYYLLNVPSSVDNTSPRPLISLRVPSWLHQPRRCRLPSWRLISDYSNSESNYKRTNRIVTEKLLVMTVCLGNRRLKGRYRPFPPSQIYHPISVGKVKLSPKQSDNLKSERNGKRLGINRW